MRISEKYNVVYIQAALYCWRDKWHVRSVNVMMTSTFVSGPTPLLWHSLQLKQFVSNETIHSYHVSLAALFSISWHCFAMPRISRCVKAACLATDFGSMLKQLAPTNGIGSTTLHLQVCLHSFHISSAWLSVVMFISWSQILWVSHFISGSHLLQHWWVSWTVVPKSHEMFVHVDHPPRPKPDSLLARLTHYIEYLTDNHPSAIIYLTGDFNCLNTSVLVSDLGLQQVVTQPTRRNSNLGFCLQQQTQWSSMLCFSLVHEDRSSSSAHQLYSS